MKRLSGLRGRAGAAGRLQHHRRHGQGHLECRRPASKTPRRRSSPHASLHRTQGPGRPDGPRERRHRRDHPEAVPEVDPALGLRPEPVRRMALPGQGRARPGPGHAQAATPTSCSTSRATQGASVLLARKNFGCGSSREHAPWALEQFGFRALIAPSYADIFFNNCFKNGLLPIVLPEAQVAQLFDEVRGLRRLRADHRPAAAGDRQARRQRTALRGASPSASTACSTASTTSA